MSGGGILGIGCDIIEIERIAKAIKNPRFLEICYSKAEIMLYENRGKSAAILAGNFAAKEAVAKAFGTGFRGFFPREIEILRNELGAPYVIISENIRGILKFAYVDVKISISNTKETAMAFCVVNSRIE